jgi:BlaI family penicillinase repressor
MQAIKLSKLELRIMDALWRNGEASIRDIQEGISEPSRPTYATVQTTVYRLEAKGAIRRTRKVGHFHIFEAIIARGAAQHRLLEDLLALFGGQARPVVAQLIDAGKLTMEDVKFAEKTLKGMQSKGVTK